MQNYKKKKLNMDSYYVLNNSLIFTETTLKTSFET